MTRLASLAAVASLLLACSSDASTGGAGCTKDTDCKDARICVSGSCVTPGTSGSPTQPGASSGTTATPPASDGSHPPKCGGDGSSCMCAVDGPYYDSADLTAGATCGASNVGSPAACCAPTDWPAHGDCFCHRLNCVESAFGDTCICSGADPSAGDKPVETCTGKGVCCVSKSDIAPMCSCFDGLTQCPDAGDVQVPSCTTSSIQCEGKSVSACN